MKERKLSPGCSQVLDRIERSFGFLFSEYGFKLAHRQDAKLGEHCLFVLESEDCRLRFISELDSISIDVGTVEAEPSWSSGPPDRMQWFPLRSVVEFLGGRTRPSYEETSALADAVWNMSNEEYDAYLAGQLQPVCAQLCLFFSKNAPQARRREFEAYLFG